MISYYDLLTMVKNGDAPRKLRVHLTYNPREYDAFDDVDGFCYYSLIGEPDDDYKDYLMDSFIESCIFDKNIEILEQDNTIDKIEMYKDYTAKGNLHTYMNINGGKFQVSEVQQEIIKRVNQIIDTFAQNK